MNDPSPISEIVTQKALHTRGMRFWALMLSILAGSVLAAFLVIQLSRVHYARKQYPLMSERTVFYAELGPGLTENAHDVETIALLAAQAGGGSADSARYLAKELAGYSQFGLGFFAQDGQFYAFLPLQAGQEQTWKEREFILSDGQGMSIRHQVSIIDAGLSYAVFGIDEFRPSGDFPAWLSEEKLALAFRQDNSSGIWYFRVREYGGLKGFIDRQASTSLRIQGSMDEGISELGSITTPEIPFVFHQIPTENGSVRFPGLSLFPPGSLQVLAGTWESLLQKPFSGASFWVWGGVKRHQESFQKEILDRLAELYPQPKPRVLPDESTVFELKTDTEPFLSYPESSEDSDIRAFLTYPDGQIDVVETEESVQFIHDDGFRDKTRDRTNNCILPTSLVYGHATGGFFEEELWKTVDFSWNKREIAICISFHP